MPVRLIAVTQPVINEVPDSQSLLAYFARVSSTANQLNHDSGPKLIASLVKRKEWSPLDMVNAVFEIETTRDIARQILRHISFRFQEFSQRYSEVTEPFVHREVRMQHKTDRQMSVEIDDPVLSKEWTRLQITVEDAVNKAYTDALNYGIAKEVARAVLPEGMTMSRLYMQGTLRSWIHYLQLRTDMKTQKEHRLLAEQMQEILLQHFPALHDVMRD